MTETTVSDLENVTDNDFALISYLLSLMICTEIFNCILIRSFGELYVKINSFMHLLAFIFSNWHFSL